MPLTNTHEYQSQSLLVTVVAGAISYFAFGMSVFAIGIIWLIPSVKPVVPDAPIQSKRKDKSRRRSAPPVLQTSKPPVLLSPVIIKSSIASETPRSSPTRHVYFIDSPTRPSAGSRRYSVPAQSSVYRDDNVSKPPCVAPLSTSPDASPRSSSSTLVHVLPSRSATIPILDACGEPNESDSSKQSRPSSVSSRPSLSLTTRFPGRIKERWGRKSSIPPIESAGESSQSDDTSSKASSVKSARRSSLGFGITPSWSVSRTRTVSDLSSVTATPSPSPRPSISTDQVVTPTNDSSSFSCLVNLPRTSKAQRRSSVPVRATVPRTQPYAYPYFAAPPTASYMDASRSTGDENRSDSSNESLPVLAKHTPETYFQDSEKKQQNAKAQASLGLGNAPLPRRIFSEGINSRT